VQGETLMIVTQSFMKAIRLPSPPLPRHHVVSMQQLVWCNPGLATTTDPTRQIVVRAPHSSPRSMTAILRIAGHVCIEAAECYGMELVMIGDLLADVDNRVTSATARGYGFSKALDPTIES
jgi:hypothetical protein